MGGIRGVNDVNLDIATHGTIIESQPIGQCTMSTWFRRTMHGVSGELCTSITKTEKRKDEDGFTIKNTYCVASVTSYIKHNEYDIPKRHISKVERMVRKYTEECTGA